MAPPSRVAIGGNGPTDRGTPEALFALLDRRFNFDYDPAASHRNRKRGRRTLPERPDIYSTLTGTYRHSSKVEPGAQDGEIRISELTGLEYPWAERRVFVNPPYARGEIGHWVKKMKIERDAAEIIVALLPVRPSAKWWWQFVKDFADITYLQFRVRFEGLDAGAPFPSCLAVFRSSLMDGHRPVALTSATAEGGIE